MKSAWTPVSKSVWTVFVTVVKFTHVFTHTFSKSVVTIHEGCRPYYATYLLCYYAVKNNN